MKRKIILCIFALLLTVSLTGCGETTSENNNNSQENTNKNENNENNNVVIDDDIIEFDDEDNTPVKGENVTVEKIINCDGCVFAYLDNAKYIGDALSEGEYTKDITKLQTKGGKQRHNFFGFVLSENKISRAYACILKDNKVYCIEGSVDGSHHESNIGILNQIFEEGQCKYISNGHTYTCTDGSYNGDTITTGYTSLHYDTSCVIYGSESNTGKLICH